ncbi:type II toxin-antitoxin system Phd/YefM family antitoxin [bacterium]|jgi:prevent-host-death family protein|nr:type II toxin-antitoxin system Phd/YefM family antitoxin [bacterium]
MKALKMIRPSDVVPIGEFKNHAASWLERARNSGHPIVITQNGKTAGILLSPAEYEKIQYEQDLSASIDQGLTELDAGQGIDTDELERKLKQHVGAKASKSK